MKKFLAAILGVTLLFAAGCSNPETDAVKKTAENFLKAQQEGDLDQSAKYTTDSVSDDMGTVKDVKEAMSVYEATGVSKDSLNDFVNDMLKAYGMVWEKYEIGNVKVDGKKATVMAKVTGISMNTWKKTMTVNLGAEVAKQWAQDHVSEIQDYLKDHTQEEAAAWIMDQVLPEAGDEALNRLKKAERETSDYRLSLEKNGDDWKISNLEVKTEK